MRKYICRLTDWKEQENYESEPCNQPAKFEVKLLVQHPYCKRWQTWRVCEDHKKHLKRDKFRQSIGKIPIFRWWSNYYKEPKKRPVIEIGGITEIKMEILDFV